MLAVARNVDLASLPEAVARFAPAGQVFVTAGRRYEVFAVSVFEGQAGFQVVDDLKYPAWLPAVLFDLEDTTLPPDWICNVFPDDDPQVIMGPRFLAQNLAAYSRMVELETEQVRRFWQRLDRLKEELG